MKKYIILLLTIGLYGEIAMAQVSTKQQLWLTNTYTFYKKDKLNIKLNSSIRFNDWGTKFFQELIRLQIHYEQTSGLEFLGGFAFSNVHNYQNPRKMSQEYRPHLGILHLTAINHNINFFNRFIWESRFFTSGTETYLNRFRFQHRLERVLNSKNCLFLINEEFFQTTEWHGLQFRINRTMLGFSHTGKSCKTELSIGLFLSINKKIIAADQVLWLTFII